MKLIKILMSSLVLLLVGCEELGMDVTSLEGVDGEDIAEVVDKLEDGIEVLRSQPYVIHVVGEPLDNGMVCDGVDDDCDGLEDSIDESKTGLQMVEFKGLKVAVFIVEKQDVVDENYMRYYMQRKLSEDELKAVEVAGDLYTMANGDDIQFNPLATAGVPDYLKGIVDVTEEQENAFIMLQKMHLEAIARVVDYYYPEIGDEVLVCFQEENLDRLSLNMDTSLMKAKEKANKTKCSNNLRMYLDDDSDGDGLDDILIMDKLRNENEAFRTDSFFDLSYAEIERILGRELSSIEMRAHGGGIDNDCDGICDDTFELLLGKYYKDEYEKYIPYLDVGEFVRGEYSLDYEEIDPTFEIKPIRIELAAYVYVRELEQGFGHDLDSEQVDLVVEFVKSRFKAGSDLSGKVNLRGVNPIYEESQKEGSNPLYKSMSEEYFYVETLINSVQKVMGPGDAHYGSITYILGRDLREDEVEALLTFRGLHKAYYDNGGALFLEAGLDQIIETSRVKISDSDRELLNIFQNTLEAQDYNSSRSNTDG